ncbi:hypothetical protein LNTAR_15297 [Lentisphaera araneosa HTCC2155]|uniref:Uncharacterized protein n=1 Tax=Lentisphaera araneosa HTCC2155 TaxID=313628 RepID=A6DRI4_9BACT|nr:hypothetical protein [Lentisphaera araneosa]EDM25794.1 hypothetical protein LNTAR_15297 [Lentisphaera araneosa HTCC2155]
MRILAHTLNNKALQLSLSLAAYLNGPVSNIIETDSDPFYTLESYLPVDYTDYSDSQLAYALEQACLHAVRSQQKETSYLTPLEIHMDTDDLNDFKVLYYHIYAHSLSII